MVTFILLVFWEGLVIFLNQNLWNISSITILMRSGTYRRKVYTKKIFFPPYKLKITVRYWGYVMAANFVENFGFILKNSDFIKNFDEFKYKMLNLDRNPARLQSERITNDIPLATIFHFKKAEILTYKLNFFRQFFSNLTKM